jgi:hypothetical protein
MENPLKLVVNGWQPYPPTFVVNVSQDNFLQWLERHTRHLQYKWLDPPAGDVVMKFYLLPPIKRPNSLWVIESVTVLRGIPPEDDMIHKRDVIKFELIPVSDGRTEIIIDAFLSPPSVGKYYVELLKEIDVAFPEAGLLKNFGEPTIMTWEQVFQLVNELKNTNGRKFGPSKITVAQKIKAVEDWEKLDKNNYSGTCQDWIDNRFGCEGGVSIVKRGTFYGWRNKYSKNKK